MPNGRTTLRLTLSAAAVAAACTLVLGAAGQQPADDAELQYQLANLLLEETRYPDALSAFDAATRAQDPGLRMRARKGKVKTALRLAEFDIALEEAERLTADAPSDVEVMSLHGDALWAAGLFDEAESVYTRTLEISPTSSRAQYGIARSLAAHSRLEEALALALKAVSVAPRDGELHHTIGDIYERLHRFDEAANAYTNFINLLPNSDRSEKAAWSRAQVRFLEAFAGRVPVEIDEQDSTMQHTVPFKLVRDKIIVRGRVNGGRPLDLVLDTGSEETVLSVETARRAGVNPITYTLSAGVGEVGLRGLQLARIDRLVIGTLEVRNLPVLIKNPELSGIPTREGDGFSPLSLGMSIKIDYQRRLLTIAKDLPEEKAEIHLPMRIHRLAMVRGLLNSTHPAYFVVDTGGEVISISAETANSLKSQYRRIPLQVYGSSGWDRDAFLMPGVDLDFDRIAYRNFPLVVLNLRAPSVLLGFQVGGIVGHKFLAGYRVTMDLARSELRLQEF